MKKEELPSLSVIMLACNQEDAIDHTLFQLLQQPMMKQLILIDCDSTDNTRQRLFYFADSDERCEVYHLNHRNESAAYNFGLEKATGEMVMFLKADMQVSHLGQLLLSARLDNADIVIGKTKDDASLAPHHQTNLATTPEIIDAMSLYGTLYRRQFLNKFQLKFNDGRDWAFIFNVMTLLASERIAIVDDVITKDEQEMAWYKEARLHDWKHFLYSMTWLLKASEPIEAVYRVMVRYVLLTAWTQFMDAAVHHKRPLSDFVEALSFYEAWLNEQAIQPNEWDLPPRFQLLYTALMQQKFQTVYALWTGPFEEPLCVMQHRYQSQIEWHRDMMTTDTGLVGFVDMVMKKDKTNFVLTGHIKLEQSLPLIEPTVEVYAVNHLYHETRHVSATVHRDHLKIEVNATDFIDVPGEWRLYIQLHSANATILLQPKTSVNDQLQIVADHHAVTLHLDQHIWLEVPEFQVVTRFDRIQLEQDALYLFLDDIRPLNLCLVNSQEERVLIGDVVSYEDKTAYRFEHPSQRRWNIVVMGYQHQKNWWRLVNEHSIFGTLAYQEVDFHWVFDESEAYLNIQDAPTAVTEFHEEDGVLRLQFDMARYLELGFKPKALLLNHDEAKQRYVLPMKHDKLAMQLYDGEFWRLNTGHYTMVMQYEKDETIIQSAVVSAEKHLEEYRHHHMEASLFMDRHHAELNVFSRRLHATHEKSKLYPFYRLLPLQSQSVAIVAHEVNENLQAMAEVLANKGYNVHWLLHDLNDQTQLSRGVMMLQKTSKAWKQLAVSRYIIDDMFISEHFGKRKAQVLMHVPHHQTSELMDKMAQQLAMLPQARHKQWKKQFQHIDAWVVSSTKQAQAIQHAFGKAIKTRQLSLPLESETDKPVLINGLKEQYGVQNKRVIGLYLTHHTLRHRDVLFALNDDDTIIMVYDKQSTIPVEWRDEVFIRTFNGQESDYYHLCDIFVTDDIGSATTYALLQRPCLLYKEEKEGFVTAHHETELIRLIFDVNSWLSSWQQTSRMIRDDMMIQPKAATALVTALLDIDTTTQKSESIVIAPMVSHFVHWLYEQLFAFVGHLPSKKTMIFESFYGEQCSDSPKALYDYAKEHYPEYQLVWTAKKGYEAVFKEAGVPYVVANSVKALLVQARAKYWIQNTRMVAWKQPPAHTTVLQTWHGTPWKRLGLDIEHVTMPGVTKEEYYDSFKQDTEKWDYLIAPNEYSLNVFRSAFDFPTYRMIPSGYPRNDALYHPSDEMMTTLKEKMNLPLDKKVILYAPTWRDNENKGQGHYEMNLALDLDKWKEAFGEDVILLIRSHYFIHHNICEGDEAIRDVSRYPDIRDLYLVSDMLITDYSSAFFDYGLLKRPMIFFAYDEAEYCHSTRGFYFDYHTVPGNIVHTNEALLKEVKAQLAHPTLHEHYDEFYRRYLSWENGKASQNVFDVMLNHKTWDYVKDPLFLEKEAVLNGEGTGFMENGDTLSLRDEKGRMTTLLARYVAKDPIHHEALGEVYYRIQFDEVTCYVSSDSLVSEPDSRFVTKL